MQDLALIVLLGTFTRSLSDRAMSHFVFPSDRHGTLCVYLFSGGLVHLGTELTKAYVGYLRPFFYQHCQPSPDYSQCTNPNYKEDIRRSFPSGHASVAFCLLTLFSLYLQHKFGVARSSSLVRTTTSTPEGGVLVWSFGRGCSTLPLRTCAADTVKTE